MQRGKIEYLDYEVSFAIEEDEPETGFVGQIAIEIIEVCGVPLSDDEADRVYNYYERQINERIIDK